MRTGLTWARDWYGRDGASLEWKRSEVNPLHVLSGRLTVGWTDRFRLRVERGFTNASTWRLLRGEERGVAADRAWRGAGGRRTVAGIARCASGGPGWCPGCREDPAGPGSARPVPGARLRGALGGGDSGRFLDSLRRCRASDATPWRYCPRPGGTATTCSRRPGR